MRVLQFVLLSSCFVPQKFRLVRNCSQLALSHGSGAPPKPKFLLSRCVIPQQRTHTLMIVLPFHFQAQYECETVFFGADESSSPALGQHQNRLRFRPGLGVKGISAQGDIYSI